MAGEGLSSFKLKKKKLKHIGVKEAVFPFARFPGVDTVLGPEMRSTGEVMGLDSSFAMAFAKSQLGGNTIVPVAGTAFISVKDEDKSRVLPAARLLAENGFKIIATGGTQRYLVSKGVEAQKVNKVLEGRPHIVDAMTNGEVQLVFNTTDGQSALQDSKSIRRAALMNKIPYYTTLPAALAAAEAINAVKHGEITVKPLQDYFS